MKTCTYTVALLILVASFIRKNGVLTYTNPFHEKSCTVAHSLTPEDAAVTMETAENWLRDYDAEGLKVFHDVAEAEWSYFTDMTEKHKQNVVSNGGIPLRPELPRIDKF